MGNESNFLQIMRLAKMEQSKKPLENAQGCTIPTQSQNIQSDIPGQTITSDSYVSRGTFSEGTQESYVSSSTVQPGIQMTQGLETRATSVSFSSIGHNAQASYGSLVSSEIPSSCAGQSTITWNPQNQSRLAFPVYGQVIWQSEEQAISNIVEPVLAQNVVTQGGLNNFTTTGRMSDPTSQLSTTTEAFISQPVVTQNLTAIPVPSITTGQSSKLNCCNIQTVLNNTSLSSCPQKAQTQVTYVPSSMIGLVPDETTRLTSSTGIYGTSGQTTHCDPCSVGNDVFERLSQGSFEYGIQVSNAEQFTAAYPEIQGVPFLQEDQPISSPFILSTTEICNDAKAFLKRKIESKVGEKGIKVMKLQQEEKDIAKVQTRKEEEKPKPEISQELLQEKREKNKFAARKCRQKRRNREKSLKKVIEELTEYNKKQQLEINVLMGEMKMLRSLLDQHQCKKKGSAFEKPVQ